jgi:hypothetical protein
MLLLLFVKHSVGRPVAPLGTHYPDSEPISLYSYSFMLHAYQFYSFWFDSTWAQTHYSQFFIAILWLSWVPSGATGLPTECFSHLPL